MEIEKLFLSHYSQHAAEVAELATELRLRGVVPWVDKDGGFTLGDDSEAEVRRAIQQDCFGVALYATPDVFARPFIRDVEMDEAKKRKARSPDFLVFAVPRGISFSELASLSSDHFSFDLSPFHTRRIADATDIGPELAAVASEVAMRVLGRAAIEQRGEIRLQFSTRELMPNNDSEILCVNGVPLIRDPEDERAWLRLLEGLRDLKRVMATTHGRPRLVVNGSKHLTGAFLFGRVFAPFEMSIRQTVTEYWSTDHPAAPARPLQGALELNPVGQPILLVEIVGRYKNVSTGVNAYLEQAGMIVPAGRLYIGPANGPLTIDAAICRSAVNQIYEEIEQAIHQVGRAVGSVEEIHLFASVPQSLMMMLGREFKGTPPTVVYEWTGERYVRACRVPGGVL